MPPSLRSVRFARGLDLGIRSHRPSDKAFIAALAGEAFGEYSPGSSRHTVSMSEEPHARTWLVVRGERRLGFAVMRPGSDRVARLDAIAVAPAARGRGMGRLLLRHVEAQARALGAVRIELATAEANLAALDLFLKEGFSIVRTRRRYYPRGQNAHILEKNLTL